MPEIQNEHCPLCGYDASRAIELCGHGFCRNDECPIEEFDPLMDIDEEYIDELRGAKLLKESMRNIEDPYLEDEDLSP